ncbi:hypothetical protein HOY80DRAFT_1114726 [Tuber brumale]|nr:hypothetical protein HOY80DRAFT_1114723 [Tuber brumale]KAG0641059.1 hypothetical protein HOY80DRAFT_1114726 [Tuber brumale]
MQEKNINSSPSEAKAGGYDLLQFRAIKLHRKHNYLNPWCQRNRSVRSGQVTTGFQSKRYGAECLEAGRPVERQFPWNQSGLCLEPPAFASGQSGQACGPGRSAWASLVTGFTGLSDRARPDCRYLQTFRYPQVFSDISRYLQISAGIFRYLPVSSNICSRLQISPGIFNYRLCTDEILADHMAYAESLPAPPDRTVHFQAICRPTWPPENAENHQDMISVIK